MSIDYQWLMKNFKKKWKKVLKNLVEHVYFRIFVV